MMSEFEIAVAEIQVERYRQTAKWGRQKHSNATWQIIATEELGEVCKAILEGKPTRHEIVQLAAVCVAWLEDNFSHASVVIEPTDKWLKAQTPKESRIKPLHGLVSPSDLTDAPSTMNPHGGEAK